jgi:hypothetical protein
MKSFDLVFEMPGQLRMSGEQVVLLMRIVLELVEMGL